MRLSRRRRGDAGREAGRQPEPIHFKVGTTPAEKVVAMWLIAGCEGSCGAWSCRCRKEVPMAGKIGLKVRKRGVAGRVGPSAGRRWRWVEAAAEAKAQEDEAEAVDGQASCGVSCSSAVLRRARSASSAQEPGFDQPRAARSLPHAGDDGIRKLSDAARRKSTAKTASFWTP